MGLPAQKATFTTEDYLAWEPTQLDRHEYLDGEVFAMPASEDMSDMRLQVAAANSYFYPDVMEPSAPCIY
jgi:Uma2 family endonuclease